MHLVIQQQGQAKSRAVSTIYLRVSPKEHLVWDNPLWCMISRSLVSTCEGEEKNNPSVPFFHGLRTASYKKTASSLPLVVESGTYTVETERRKGGKGGREACLQISAISQPDCLLTLRGHCSGFPLDGERKGLEARGWGYGGC